GVRPESVWVSGPLVVELGRWHFDVPPGAKRPAGATHPESGKYMARWGNENGHWLIMESIWNSDLPVATPPAQKHCRQPRGRTGGGGPGPQVTSRSAAAIAPTSSSAARRNGAPGTP